MEDGRYEYIKYATINDYINYTTEQLEYQSQITWNYMTFRNEDLRSRDYLKKSNDSTPIVYKN
ncbi:expressed protein [Dictyostelium purpureum]|uniref:Expressed protein n=1 Tax=Dictyostelium purpureum TaxID=5786 RepID=F0ZU99_DICPU|nr:uncharacterized protein DICPUDRAFT_95271 [Dictyostelium purpureum]EGC32490.1 expressed protein [Dictyostelium purpureum]|eukprot:XP_003290983.1 expressed protein [Dictyostelium purpureum]